MKKQIYGVLLLMLLTLLPRMGVCAQGEVPDELRQLYARSAVLMDGGSGRILFGKNEDEVLPMASTTKIMTCILTLEHAGLQDTVTVSENAASQPEVRLGMRAGERYRLEHLLCSLMLESHNDSAVAIAEHVGGSVEGFAALMNQKAAELGCVNTHYVTPNGLDDKDAGGDHATTAAELARIMRYCVSESPMREEFLRITQTAACSFTDESGQRSFSCQNHNAFLNMMDGVISGKTGYTSKAGYCYVCALQSGERLFIVSLLACGWPNNRTYKWSDTGKLMRYGLEHYAYQTITLPAGETALAVENGLAENGDPWQPVTVPVRAQTDGESSFSVLLGSGEQVKKTVTIQKSLTAPVAKDTCVGKLQYYFEDTLLREYDIVTLRGIPVRELRHWFLWTLGTYAL